MTRMGVPKPLLVLLLVAFAAAPVSAVEVFRQAGQPYRGRVDYVFVGASMTDNRGLQNGVNCIKTSAQTTVRPADLPARSRLLTATLYIGGSLIEDDADYPDLRLFTPPSGARADIDPVPVEVAALQAADRSVTFRPPGASAPVTVTATGEAYVSVLYKPPGPGNSEPGNLAFFLTPIDVTAVITDAGGGALAGVYEVSDLLADVCYGLEVICSDEPGAPTCGTTPGSNTHTNGAASFALLLVVEDVSLPQREITVFEGLVDLAGRTVTERLTLASAISSPAAGSLSIYGLEGDLLLPLQPNDTGPCLADEYAEVDGDTDPDTGGLCLEDDDNPNENLFNGTINGQPRAGDEPLCTQDAAHQYLCCNGDGRCGVVGVDIDRFDISPALVPGATRVRTTLRSGQDQFYLGAMVLGVEVFEPTLVVDTQIRVLTADADGNVQLGGPIVYSIAISNTGNVIARDVRVVMDAPAVTSGFQILVVPPEAINLSSPEGGSGTGRVDVSGFDVPAGDIAEVRFVVTTTCDLGLSFSPTARVSAAGLLSFDVPTPQVTPRGPGVKGTICEGRDPDGPFAVREDPNRVLAGGGGCNAVTRTGASLALLLVVVVTVVFSRRARRGMRLSLLVLALGLGLSGCGTRHDPHLDPGPPDHVISDLDGLPGEPCGSLLLVVITRADGSTFCIDRFEATLGEGALGRAHQGDDDGTITDADDAVMTIDGSTNAPATVALGVQPAADVSWYQAKSACANAGKRLCTVEEWERACRGPSATTYPYGDTHDEKACLGFFAYGDQKPAPTGSLDTCGSTFGVYDLSGNLEEWTATAVERIAGTGTLVDRAVRGGSFNSNAQALACSGPEFHAAPGAAEADRGFRCCHDGP